jgi:hypothetical protein
MPMQIHGLDSRKRRFTKKVRKISLLATGNTILFQPSVGTRYLLVGAYTEARGVLGTVTVAPHILIDNGTDSGSGGINLVADVALGTADKIAKILTLAAPLTVLDETQNIRIKCGTAQTGGTAYPINVVLELLMLSN